MLLSQRGVPAAIVALVASSALLVAACSVSTGSGSKTATTGPRQSEIDRKDTATIEQQVNKQVDDRMQSATAGQGTIVQSDTTCTKQSDTAYKCLTTFTSPPNQPQAVTDVTCDRSGGSCITETR